MEIMPKCPSISSATPTTDLLALNPSVQLFQQWAEHAVVLVRHLLELGRSDWVPLRQRPSQLALSSVIGTSGGHPSSIDEGVTLPVQDGVREPIDHRTSESGQAA